MTPAPRLTLVLCLLGCCAAAMSQSPALRVELNDGATLAGQVQFTAAGLAIAAGTQPTVVRLSSIRRISEPTPAELAVGTPAATAGLAAEYFGDLHLTDRLLSRTDLTCTFTSRAPVGGLDLRSLPNSFSARWTGELDPPITGKYRIEVASDGGARVTIGGIPVIDHWKSDTQTGGDVILRAHQKIPITIEYMHPEADAVFILKWNAPGLIPGVIPASALSHAAASPTTQPAPQPAPATPAPAWEDRRIAEAPAPLVATQNDSELLLTSDPGEIRTTPDVLRFWCQSVFGQADFSAKLAGVKSLGDSYAIGGLMLRERLDRDSPFVAVTLDSNHVAQVLVRRLVWNAPESIPIPLHEGDHARIVLRQSSIQVLVSPDGKTWRGVWRENIRFTGENFAGAFVVPRTGKGTLRASHLALTRPAPAASTVPGVMLTDQTFLAGEVRSLDSDTLLLHHRDTDLKVPTASVAYIAFASTSATTAEVTPEDLAVLESAGPCALLASGDTFPGELTELKDQHAVLTSTLFGDRTFRCGGAELTTYSFRPSQTSSALTHVKLKDGSIIHCQSVTASPEGLACASSLLPAEFPVVRWSELQEYSRS